MDYILLMIYYLVSLNMCLMILYLLVIISHLHLVLKKVVYLYN